MKTSVKIGDVGYVVPEAGGSPGDIVRSASMWSWEKRFGILAGVLDIDQW